MEVCKKHDLVYNGANCPACVLEEQHKADKDTITKLLNLRTNLSMDRIMYVSDMAKALAKSEHTIYAWSSQEYKSIPILHNGKKIYSVQGKLKEWAELHGIPYQLVI